jgi:hypothetical protein
VKLLIAEPFCHSPFDPSGCDELGPHRDNIGTVGQTPLYREKLSRPNIGQLAMTWQSLSKRKPFRKTDCLKIARLKIANGRCPHRQMFSTIANRCGAGTLSRRPRVSRGFASWDRPCDSRVVLRYYRRMCRVAPGTDFAGERASFLALPAARTGRMSAGAGLGAANFRERCCVTHPCGAQSSPSLVRRICCA